MHASQFIAKSTALSVFDVVVLRQLSEKIEVETSEAVNVPLTHCEGVVYNVVRQVSTQLSETQRSTY